VLHFAWIIAKSVRFVTAFGVWRNRACAGTTRVQPLPEIVGLLDRQRLNLADIGQHLPSRHGLFAQSLDLVLERTQPRHIARDSRRVIQQSSSGSFDPDRHGRIGLRPRRLGMSKNAM
jgi:hypothetical protein